MTITGFIKGTSRDRLYQEVGLESLKQRRWYRRLTTFYQILKTKSPLYLFSLIPAPIVNNRTRSFVNIPLFKTRTAFFQNSFFPNALRELNALNANTREITSVSVFKKTIIKSIRPLPNPIFDIHFPLGLKFLTRLRLSFSHLREHKFKHNFQDTINPLCNCSINVESTEHFFLKCLNFNHQRQILLDSLNNLGIDIVDYQDSDLVDILLFGSPDFDDLSNQQILLNSIVYITSTNRFNDNLF